MQKIRTVHAKAVDGSEKELALVRIEGGTAYVCPKQKYSEAIKGDEIVIGFPLRDVRFDDAA